MSNIVRKLVGAQQPVCGGVVWSIYSCRDLRTGETWEEQLPSNAELPPLEFQLDREGGHGTIHRIIVEHFHIKVLRKHWMQSISQYEDFFQQVSCQPFYNS